MFIYKIDKKTGKKYRITVPDWDTPVYTGNNSSVQSAGGVFNPIFLDLNTNGYYQLYATSSAGVETFGIQLVGFTGSYYPAAGSTYSVYIQDTITNSWLTLFVSGSLGNEVLYSTASSYTPPSQTFVTLYDKQQGNYYRLSVSASAISMSFYK